MRPFIDDLREFFDQINYAISIMRGERLTVTTTYLLNRLQYLRGLIGKRLYAECRHLGVTPWEELVEFEQKEEPCKP